MILRVISIIFLSLALIPAERCIAGPAEPVVPYAIELRTRPFNLVLEGRRVLSIIGDSLVYDLGNETIVITSTDYEVRKFAANVKAGRRAGKLSITLVPEQKNLYNARFQAFLLHHPSLSKHPPAPN